MGDSYIHKKRGTLNRKLKCYLGQVACLRTPRFKKALISCTHSGLTRSQGTTTSSRYIMALTIGDFDVSLAPTISPEDKKACQSAPFNPSINELPKGFRKSQSKAAFPVDTVFEQDVAVPMRDGVKLYCDIFRPKGKSGIPAILVWSPYGKGGNGTSSYPTCRAGLTRH